MSEQILLYKKIIVMGMGQEKDPKGEETIKSLQNTAQSFSFCVFQLLSSRQQIERSQGPVPSMNTVVNTQISAMHGPPLSGNRSLNG